MPPEIIRHFLQIRKVSGGEHGAMIILRAINLLSFSCLPILLRSPANYQCRRTALGQGLEWCKRLPTSRHSFRRSRRNNFPRNNCAGHLPFVQLLVSSCFLKTFAVAYREQKGKRRTTGGGDWAPGTLMNGLVPWTGSELKLKTGTLMNGLVPWTGSELKLGQ